jgi:hypothetical protein
LPTDDEKIMRLIIPFDIGGAAESGETAAAAAGEAISFMIGSTGSARPPRLDRYLRDLACNDTLED